MLKYDLMTLDTLIVPMAEDMDKTTLTPTQVASVSSQSNTNDESEA